MRTWTSLVAVASVACAAAPPPSTATARAPAGSAGDQIDPDSVEVSGVAPGRCGPPRAVVGHWGAHREALAPIRRACVVGDSVVLEYAAVPPTTAAGVRIAPRAGHRGAGINHWDPYLQGEVVAPGPDVVTWSTTRLGTCRVATFAASAPTVTFAPCPLAPAPAPAAPTAPLPPAAVADTDRDQIPDADDPCPTEPENVDGFEDRDGCPDRRGIQVAR